jgi:hypothetical protein
MAKLVLLVVAAAWAAVLIPPMLRSRVDNRPNSSVTDFRRQLNRLQSTSTPPRGARAMGRPLAQSPLQRQAAAGRPGQSAPARQATMRSGNTAVRDRTGETSRMRSHGDPSSGQRRPDNTRGQRRPDQSQEQRRPDQSRGQRRPHQSQEQRRPQEPQARSRPVDSPAPQRSHDNTNGTRRLLDDAAVAKRRRANVLFVLVVTSACTMFLAATTDSVVMLWVFGLSFIATCGYLYVLTQQRENDQQAGWLNQR